LRIADRAKFAEMLANPESGIILLLTLCGDTNTSLIWDYSPVNTMGEWVAESRAGGDSALGMLGRAHGNGSLGVKMGEIMTSPERMASQIANAQKSTGPKTEAGKLRSRANATKHGLTARTVLLPNEDPADYEKTVLGWFDSCKPTDQCEVFLVERLAYHSFQLNRATRADFARLRINAQTGDLDEENRIELEVTWLSSRLLRAPGGRPSVFPCASRLAEEQEHQKIRTDSFDDAEHPKVLIGRLKSTGAGCARLLVLWNELRESLEMEGGYWLAPERFRGFRLLGLHPIDVCMTKELAFILKACRTLDPDAGSLVGEVWNDMVAPEKLPSLEWAYQRAIAHSGVMAQEAAREFLMEIVAREIRGLEERVGRYDERAKHEGRVAPQLAAFDNSREGELRRRYEVSCERFFYRSLDELRRRQGEKAPRNERRGQGEYYRPMPGRTQTMGGEGCKPGSLPMDEERRREDEGPASTIGAVDEAMQVIVETLNAAGIDVGREPRQQVSERVSGDDRTGAESRQPGEVLTGSKRERRRRRRLERAGLLR
jgi:hypothetical protein